ncbi:MAG: type II toxin-antitoxin system VapC family toxin [Fibromonadaceae bacterium]|jgi:predicted nucleic acid-binding protein|nr:type II toxin-antitoxin system VapC family toxin [Fibromonadaceae bacterium]
MNIVDSSLWVEYFLENDIDFSIISAIKDTKRLYVPSICLYEVYKKFLSVNDVEKANLAVDIMQNATIVSITPRIAVFAAKLSKEHKLPMADSVIYATAKIYNAKIYTQDKHFENLEQVHYFAK